MLCFCRQAMAQTPYIRAVNYPYQIGTKTIYDLYVDTRGQLWLGSDFGLFRFNGKQAQAIPFEASRQTDFTHLKTDSYGKLWGMNFSNQLAYVSRDTLRSYQFPEELQLEGNLIDFDFTPQCIWLCTETMVVAIHLKSNKIRYQYKERQALFYSIKAFEGKIHVLKIGQDMVCDDKGNMELIPTCLEEVGRFTVKGEELLVAHKDMFSRKACRFRGGKWETLPDFEMPQSAVVYHLSTSADAQTWICSNQGGWLWDSSTGETQNLFPQLQVSDVVQDYQGNYWISSLNDGLWFCPSLHSLVFTPIPALREENAFITNIQQVDLGDSRYWISSSRGRSYYTRLEGQAKGYLEGNFKQGITNFLKGAHQDEVISTSGIFNTQTRGFIPLPVPKDITRYGDNYLLIARSSSAEWIAPYASPSPPAKKAFGIALNPENEFIYQYPTYLIRMQRSYSVCIDSLRQKYWVGYADDLYEYDFKGNYRIIRRPDGIPIIVGGMCLDKEGLLYAATFNQGLLLIKNQEIVQHLGKKHLLKSNIIRKVINYKDTIWIGTDKEIGYLSPDRKRFTDVLGRHSMHKMIYQDFIPSAQSLLIATGTKILSLPLHTSRNSPKLRLLPACIFQEGNNVQVTLETLNYTNPEASRFYYRLVSIDNKWQQIDDIQTSIRYSQLYPGRYTLEYYAEDSFSKARSDVQKITFVVAKKWWQQLWFYLLSTLIFLATLASIFYLWHRRTQKRQLLREQLWVSQLKAIKAQMNPHFLYNILNTVQGLVYSNRKGEASALLAKFSDLVRHTLESSEIPYLPLKDEISILQLYLNLEQSRFEGKDFKYDIQYEAANALLDHEIPSMLIQPFVENALKHGLLHKKNEKRLLIHFQQRANTLIIKIEDNGVGREYTAKIKQRQARRVQHFTMNATQQRIDLLNKMGQFNIKFQLTDLGKPQSTNMSGTRIEIMITFLKPQSL